MATVTDPIILDSTGQDIVTALNNLNTPRDTAAYTTSFASSDTDDASATSWTVVSPIAGGETHATLFGKLSQIAKNVRYLYNQLTAVNDSQKFSAWALLNTVTSDSGTITNYDEYDEFMVVLKRSSLILNTFIFDKAYVVTQKRFTASYYLTSSNHVLYTIGITEDAYSYGSGGGEAGGTIEIYGRKYA